MNPETRRGLADRLRAVAAPVGAGMFLKPASARWLQGVFGGWNEMMAELRARGEHDSADSSPSDAVESMVPDTPEDLELIAELQRTWSQARDLALESLQVGGWWAASDLGWWQRSAWRSDEFPGATGPNDLMPPPDDTSSPASADPRFRGWPLEALAVERWRDRVAWSGQPDWTWTAGPREIRTVAVAADWAGRCRTASEPGPIGLWAPIHQLSALEQRTVWLERARALRGLSTP